MSDKKKRNSYPDFVILKFRPPNFERRINSPALSKRIDALAATLREYKGQQVLVIEKEEIGYGCSSGMFTKGYRVDSTYKLGIIKGKLKKSLEGPIDDRKIILPTQEHVAIYLASRGEQPAWKKYEKPLEIHGPDLVYLEKLLSPAQVQRRGRSIESRLERNRRMEKGLVVLIGDIDVGLLFNIPEDAFTEYLSGQRKHKTLEAHEKYAKEFIEDFGRGKNDHAVQMYKKALKFLGAKPHKIFEK